MRRCCAPLGVLLAASTTQSLSFTAQSRLSRVHPARRTAPPTLGAIALLAEQLEVVRSIRPADDSAEVQFKLWENAGLNPTYKVSGSISGEPSYTRLFSHADWREYSGTEPLERWMRAIVTWRYSTVLRALWKLSLLAALWAYAVASLPAALLPRTSPVPMSLFGQALGLLLVFRTNNTYQRLAEACALIPAR